MSDRSVQQMGSVWPLIEFNIGLTDLTAAFDGRSDDQFGTFDDPFDGLLKYRK
jgi:hypothetical protein